MKEFCERLVASFVIFTFLMSFRPVEAAVLQPASVPADDERNVEKERQEAIYEAVAFLEPSLAVHEEPPTLEGEIKAHDIILEEVEQLRQLRKAQFKHLTWSHIRSTITPEAILAKHRFLAEREQSLSRIVERAVELHLPAQIARERIGMAQFRIAKSVRDFLPEATATADIKSGQLTGDSFVSDNWRMKLRQPVFRGGVLWNTLLMEGSNLEIAKREYDKAISDLVADVSKAYFEFERAQNALRDQETLYEKVKEQKRISDEKYAAKLISEIEKLNTDSLYSQAEYDRETAQQEIELAKLELQKFLKLTTDDDIYLTALYDLEEFDLDVLRKAGALPAGTKQETSESNLDQLIDRAYQYRPDLQVEASKLKAAQLAYHVALGKRLPQFDFLVEFGELAEAFIVNDKGPHHRHEFRVGMELTWPFAGNTLKYTYDHDQRAPSVTQFLQGAGTRIRANSFSAAILDDLGQFAAMKKAKIESLEQVVALEKTEREVVKDVKEAYFNFQKSRIQVESAYKRMGYRERLAEREKHRLERNEIQISEYLQAEIAHTEERGLLYKAISDFFSSMAKLNRAIGIRDYLEVEVLA